MKDSLSHLPPDKQAELKLIVEQIRKNTSPEMIILFGSYARGDYKEQKDLEPDRKSGHVSDYDILVVTSEKKTAADKNLWSIITEQCNELELSTHARIIANDIQFLNIQLAEGYYFFSDIKKEGVVLYDTGQYELADERELNQAEKQRIAQDHFDHWFGSAKSSYLVYEQCLRIKEHNEAAFNLHQAAEKSYKAILLVFTNYNPNEHYLLMLGMSAARHESALMDIFPMETEKQQKLFELLDYAYIGARYDPEYHIKKEQLECLAEKVKKLQQITRRICKEKIESFVDT